VRAQGDLAEVTAAVHGVVAHEEMAAELQMVYTLDELVAGAAGPLRNRGMAAVVVGAVALLLSACGLYAIASFSVTRRTREIGIRQALGARPSRILGSILLRSTAPLLIGAVLGTALGSAGAVVLAWLLPLNALRAGSSVLLVVAVSMILVGVVASIVPARRALLVRPMEALRHG
jgi:putative ABC transport system permease protein